MTSPPQAPQAPQPSLLPPTSPPPPLPLTILYSVFRFVYFFNESFRISFQINNVHVYKPFECDLCGRTFHHKVTLVNHLNGKLHNPDRLKCRICSEKFVSQRMFDKHSDYHTYGSYLRCHCGKDFKSVPHLTNHKYRVHPSPSKEFKCKMCSKVFKTSPSLEHHFVAHHSPKSPCDHCQKMLPLGALMNQHVKNYHCGPLKCSVEGCTKIYNCKSSLKQHLARRHAPLKNLECPKCEVIFTNELSLKHHLSVQHRKKIFSCKVEGCVYRAIRSDYMRKHYRCHKNISEATRAELLVSSRKPKTVI